MRLMRGLCMLFVLDGLCDAAMGATVASSTEIAVRTEQPIDMCTIWVYDAWCEIEVDGITLEQSELTIPCSSEVTLFFPATPDCNFRCWHIPPEGLLPWEFLVFENPWRFSPLELPTDREPNIRVLLNVEPLHFVQRLENTALYMGQSWRFQVVVEGGTSQKGYIWWKDGRQLDSELPFLPIHSARTEDAGWFTCQVWSQGTYGVESSARLEVFPRAEIGFHHADSDEDWFISIHELLRVIQFYSVGGYHCAAGTEDGFAPGLGDDSCSAHHGDYGDEDWAFSLNEVLRIIQFYNASCGTYHAEPGTEDGFAPQAG